MFSQLFLPLFHLFYKENCSSALSFLNPTAISELEEDSHEDELTTVPQTFLPLPPSPIQRFGQSYQEIHGYLSTAVCVLGIVCNVLNMAVLTRKHMRNSTNWILTALALVDMMVMSFYLVVAVYLYIVTSPNCFVWAHSEGWMSLMLAVNFIMFTCHYTSAWLTVALALFRYIFVCKPTQAGRWCAMSRAKLLVAVVVVGSLLSSIPIYLSYTVVDISTRLEGQNFSCFGIMASDLAMTHPTFEQATRWWHGVVSKILPCVLMAALSTRVIVAMQVARRRRRRLLTGAARAGQQDRQQCRDHTRTTLMLLSVVIFFILTELPQGILAWMSAVDAVFWFEVYIHLGDLMDILVLINSTVNFLLYCAMSRQFRHTFRDLFLCRL